MWYDTVPLNRSDHQQSRALRTVRPPRRTNENVEKHGIRSILCFSHYYQQGWHTPFSLRIVFQDSNKFYKIEYIIIYFSVCAYFWCKYRFSYTVLQFTVWSVLTCSVTYITSHSFIETWLGNFLLPGCLTGRNFIYRLCSELLDVSLPV